MGKKREYKKLLNDLLAALGYGEITAIEYTPVNGSQREPCYWVGMRKPSNVLSTQSFRSVIYEVRRDHRNLATLEVAISKLEEI